MHAKVIQFSGILPKIGAPTNYLIFQTSDMESERIISSEDEQEEEKDEILKRRISTHPLYELLVEAHLKCLKVGEISSLDREQKMDQKQAMNKHNWEMFSQSELDLFMEAYCLALGKLKEAMEEPQQKSMAFISNMHSQLKELTKTTLPAPPQPVQATSSGDCNFKTDSTV